MNRTASSFLAGTVPAVLSCIPSNASLVSVDFAKDADYSQTNVGGPLTFNGYFFAARAFYGLVGNFDGGNIAFPGGTSDRDGRDRLFNGA
jgi:hypothetical protein